MNLSLRNNVVIVTGAGSGIGAAIAERFAEEEASVIVADIDKEGGSRVANAIVDRGLLATFTTADVSSAESMKQLFATTITQFGKLDAIVNNAGVNFVKPLGETTLEDWEHVIGVDLRGTFLGCQLAIEQFLRQGTGGSITNISSVHSVATLPYASPYAAAKGGVTQLTRSLAIEFGQHNIRVNAVSPGLTNTQIWQDLKLSGPDAARVIDHWMRNIALGREAEPKEVANMVVWLASDEASYVTGANLFVDGGMTAMLTNREGA